MSRIHRDARFAVEYALSTSCSAFQPGARSLADFRLPPFPVGPNRHWHSNHALPDFIGSEGGLKSGAKRLERLQIFILVLLVGELCASLAPAAHAQTTYRYQGNQFTHFDGLTCPPECSITGYFTVSSPLLPNSTYNLTSSAVPIVANNWAIVTSSSFTDGLITDNYLDKNDGDLVITDSRGNIAQWLIIVWDGPDHINGMITRAGYFNLQQGDYVFVYIGSPQPGCYLSLPVAGLSYGCDAYNGIFSPASPGTWTVPPCQHL